MNNARIWLRLEGGVVLVAAATVYSAQDFSTLWFLLLLLTPDVFMAGYLGGDGLGRKIYNLGHTYVLPAALGGLAILNGLDIALQASLIWIAHIGFDRLMGYGLKTGTFKQTHLGTIGKNKSK